MQYAATLLTKRGCLQHAAAGKLERLEESSAWLPPLALALDIMAIMHALQMNDVMHNTKLLQLERSNVSEVGAELEVAAVTSFLSECAYLLVGFFCPAEKVLV